MGRTRRTRKRVQPVPGSDGVAEVDRVELPPDEVITQLRALAEEVLAVNRIVDEISRTTGNALGDPAPYEMTRGGPTSSSKHFNTAVDASQVPQESGADRMANGLTSGRVGPQMAYMAASAIIGPTKKAEIAAIVKRQDVRAEEILAGMDGPSLKDIARADHVMLARIAGEAKSMRADRLVPLRNFIKEHRAMLHREVDRRIQATDPNGASLAFLVLSTTEQRAQLVDPSLAERSPRVAKGIGLVGV
jgi:hypothetical protein